MKIAENTKDSRKAATYVYYLMAAAIAVVFATPAWIYFYPTLVYNRYGSRRLHHSKSQLERVSPCRHEEDIFTEQQGTHHRACACGKT